MKLSLKKVQNGCRLGLLSNFGQCKEVVLETPVCMSYTRAGCVPYLTKDMQQKISIMPALLQMPLTLLAENHENVSGLDGGLKKFTSSQDKIVHCCLHDPTQEVPSGYNDKQGASIWTKSGRLKIDVDLFMRIQEAFQPDMYEVLADADTPKEPSSKRMRKSFDRSMQFLDRCLEKHLASDKLKNTSILGVVEGGLKEEDRKVSAKAVAQRPVDGFCIRGLHNYGPDTENFKSKELQSALRASICELPEDKPRFLTSILNPTSVLHSVECGVDVIDSSYAYLVSERGSALCFSHTLPPLKSDGDGVEEEYGEEEEEELRDGYEINLKDKKYVEDFRPLVSGCTCYTCEKYSRAYVNHLLNTSELLATILLMVHNLHHYFGFFDSIRKSISSDRYQELKDRIIKQDAS